MTNEEYTPPPIMVNVTAPSTLPAGYTFEVSYVDDERRIHSFTCEVVRFCFVPFGNQCQSWFRRIGSFLPPLYFLSSLERKALTAIHALTSTSFPSFFLAARGWSYAGQIFSAPLPSSERPNIIRAPNGRWKDGLCNCFSLGIYHPSLCWSIWLPPIAMGQIMTRMSLNWLGQHGNRVFTKYTCTSVAIITYTYVLLEITVQCLQHFLPDEGFLVQKFVGLSVTSLFFSWFLYALKMTRQRVREQYSIPGEQCGSYEDVCCSLFCACCVVSQMARHTGEYETYPGICCSTTGHPEGTPLTINEDVV